MLKSLFTVAAVFSLCFSISAQEIFKAEPNRIEITKAASFEFFYDYSDMINLTDSILDMRWVRIEENNVNEVSGTMDTPGGNWNFWMTDPMTTYSPSIGVDSGDFQLPPADVVVNSNKLIYQIFPNGEYGISFTKFRVFPIAHPDEYIDVSFKYIAESFVSAVDESPLEESNIYFDHNASQLVIQNKSATSLNFSIYNSIGALLEQGDIERSTTQNVQLSDSGIIFVVLEKNGQLTTQKIWVSGN